MLMAEAPSHTPKVILECIAGVDLHRKVMIIDQPVTIAHAAYNPDLAIEALTRDEGYIIARLENGLLVLDGIHCYVPLIVNDEGGSFIVLREKDILRLGNSIWRAHYGGDPASISLKEGFTSLIGLEELTDFKLSQIFSEVFKKHSSDEMEEQLITGTARHTPSLADLELGWARPWLFARLLAASAVLAFILYEAFELFNNVNLIPGLIFIGSFAVPVSTLLFFLEMNAPRNVSIFKVMQLLFVGGVASLIVALIFFSRFDFFTTFLGASAAGIIEETAKLLIVALLMGQAQRYKWVLNGLLFGAAVGTGFGAFESAGYSFRAMLGNGVDAGVASIMLRALLAPFMHIVWTANSAAALWLVKGDKPFSWNMLKEPAFLRIFIAMILIHMIWNAPFSLLQLPIVLDLKFVILGVLDWVICFRLVQVGLRQLNKARQELALPAIAEAEQSSPVN